MLASARAAAGRAVLAQRTAWAGAGAAATALLLVVYQVLLAPAAGTRSGPPPRPTAAPALIHVIGAVVQPGVYEVAAGGRVEDAIRLAGGATEDAEPGLLNLAARLSDGQRVVVPRRSGGGTPGPPPLAGGTPGAAGRVNLNTASQADLDALPGIGPVLAQRIVEQREQAPFTSVEQLVERKLVSASTLQRLRDLVAAE